MKKYNVMLYPYRHASKKEAQKYVGAIKNNILNNPSEITIEQLAVSMTDGFTVILGHAEYSQEEKDIMLLSNKKIGASDKHWINQQLFAIDFDNDGDKYLSIEDAIKICSANEVEPAFIYTTDSHTDDRNRFRVVFAMDTLINDERAHRAVVGSLFNLFTIDDECLVDIKCRDRCRLFYPGKKIVYKNYGATVNASLLINSYVEDDSKCKQPSKNPSKAINNKVHNNLSEMIRLIKENQVEKIRNSFFLKVKNLLAQTEQGLEVCLLKGEQVSYISLFTEDTCSPQGRKPAKPVTVRHPSDYYEIVRQLPMDLLLDLPMNTNFNCILPSHNDNSPSARIELAKDGHYIYHCYGCNSYLDLFDVLEKVVGLSHYQVKAFINKLLNIKFETEWQIEKKQDILEYQDYMWGEDLKLSYPLLYKRLRRAKALRVLNLVLQMARLYLYDCKVTGDKKYLFYMSLSLMVSKAKDFLSENITKSVLHKKIKFLTSLGLIDIIQEEDLPAKFKKELQARKLKNEQHYRISCYSIPMFTMGLLHDAQETIKDMESIGVRRKHYCREAELRANGIDSANSQFVQDANKGLSAEVELFYKKYSAVAATLIAIKGWTTEKEILSKVKNYLDSKKQEYSGICLPQLLRESQLKRVPYLKEHEIKFVIKKGLLSYGVSKIIIREDHK